MCYCEDILPVCIATDTNIDILQLCCATEKAWYFTVMQYGSDAVM